MNEETIFEKRPNNSGQRISNDKGVAWKQVTLGGVSGILMGAGLPYAGQTLANVFDSNDVDGGNSHSHTTDNGLNVADVNQNLSFGQAFAAARAEVGPGGVFHWHGGIYNTFTADEWNTMSVEQKHDFAQQVKPEVSVDEISTPTDANTHVIVEHHVYHHDSHPVNEVHQVEEIAVHDQQIADTDDSDVHIVGYTNVQGHLTVGVDMDGDNQADVAIIDVDDNQVVSDPDLVVDRDGNYATIGELVNGNDPNMDASNETPDFSEDNSVGTDYPLYDI
ncbi:MAG: hypothetical protein IKX61_00160 [Prevotella sp.]|nr:hypothetical protein [Prevotella sp.]